MHVKNLIREAVDGEGKSQDQAELEAAARENDIDAVVIGCGGAGTNTVTRLTQAGIAGAEAYAVNTDAQHLLSADAPNKILIGKELTKGHGAGSHPQVGEKAAINSEDELREAVQGADLVFVTCGLGGGTGSGSIPVVSQIADQAGALTIAVTTLPFSVEGQVRMKIARAGLARLRRSADTTIVVPNDKLLEVAENLPLQKAFKVVDEVLMQAIKGLTELVTTPGVVNLDFGDLRTIMEGGGVAMIGIGESAGEGRCERALAEALRNPLLDVDLSKATGCLVNVVGDDDMTIGEAETAVQSLKDRIDPNARIIWGTNVDSSLSGQVRVMVVLTGVKSKQILQRTAQAKERRSEDFQVVDG